MAAPLENRALEELKLAAAIRCLTQTIKRAIEEAVADTLRLRAESYKAGFDPSQPRVPRGNPEGGEWTDGGGGGGGGSGGGSQTGTGAGNQLPGGRGGSRSPSPHPTHPLRTYPRNSNPSPVKRLEVHGNEKITLHHADGSTETRTGGSRAWRNNNPGNLRPGDFSTRHGAIGDNNHFAVFPDAAYG